MSGDQKGAAYDASVKLCRAVQEHPCIFDRESPQYVKREWYDQAWKSIAKSCDETVPACKLRWRNIRTAFIRSIQGTPKQRLPNRTREYYLHEVLQFLLPHISNFPESEKEHLSEEEEKAREQMKNDSWEEEVNTETKEQDLPAGKPKRKILTVKNKVRTFFIKQKSNKPSTFLVENPSEKLSGKTDVKTSEPANHKNDMKKIYMTKKSDGGARFRFRRACKRSLDKTMVRELRVRKREPEVKRQRRIVQRSKSFTKDTAVSLLEEGNTSLEQQQMEANENGMGYVSNVTLPAVTRDDKNITTNATKSDEDFTLLPSSISDKSMLYRFNSNAADDDFLNSLKPQMSEMNIRQKLHFKKKIFQSLIEVFDDPTNFPICGEASNFSRPHVFPESTISQTQATKHSPDIVGASALSSNSEPYAQTAGMQTLNDTPAITDNQSVSFLKLAENALVDTPRDKAKNQEMKAALPTVRKVVKITGSPVLQAGDKRCIYRVLPRRPFVGASEPTATKSSVGTFIIPRTGAPTVTFVPSSMSSLSSSAFRQVTVQANGTSKVPLRAFPISFSSSTIKSGVFDNFEQRASNIHSVIPSNGAIRRNSVGVFQPKDISRETADLANVKTLDVLKTPVTTSTVTSFSSTSPKTCITTSVPMTLIPQHLPKANGEAGKKASSQLTTDKAASPPATSTPKVEASKRTLRSKPDKTEKTSKVANESIEETAGVIASDDFASLVIKTELLDVTFP